MYKLSSLSVLVLATTFGGCARHSWPESDLDVAAEVDPDQYLGTWYEIASFPMRAQADCTGTTATYSLREDGDIEVYNRCLVGSLDGEVKDITGKAWIVDTDTNARLKVQFFWPFAADYWILDVDEDYQWALVGHPEREYLWILSRTPQLEDATYNLLLDELEQVHGYDLAPLVDTLQPEE